MTDPAATTPRTIALLSDDPSESDDFAGKAHAQVARAIANLINTGRGGKVIGLEGTWGSGKSTVVKLLCGEVQIAPEKPATQSPATHPVIFDAWAHQGDPLRRAFLETVISELERIRWLTVETADSFRKQLSGRTSITNTTSTPKFSLEGRIAASAAVLIPLGLALFTNDFKQHHRASQIVGLVLLVLPLLVVFMSWLAKRASIRFDGKKQPKESRRRRLADLDPFGFFAKEQNEVTTATESVESGEPTSVEFERLFGHLLEKALDDEKRLLIILDNLDRVDASDARGVLATMRTFTGSAATSSTDQIWTLIPYDRSGLGRLWDSTEGKSESPGPSTATAFVEKVFQAHFETPPLILSDWRGYLSRLLREAIPDVSDDEIAAVRSIRAQYRGPLASQTPTPRQLKQFVNQIALLAGRRVGIPLNHVAYYVLLRDDEIDVAEGLRVGRIPQPHLAHIFDEQSPALLAALYYGTSVDVGQQLLVSGDLDNAFAREDSAAVAELMDAPGFMDALETLQLDDRLADGAVEFSRLAATLERANAFDRPTIHQWSDRELLPRARGNESWVLSGAESGAGASFLLDSLGDDPTLVEHLRLIQPSPNEADTEGQLQLEGAASLAIGLARRGRRDESISVRIAIPVERLVGSLATYHSLTADEPAARGLLDPSVGVEQAGQTLGSALTTEAFAPVASALDVLSTGPTRVGLTNLAQTVLDWYKSDDPASVGQLEAQLAALDVCRSLGSIDDLIGEAADDGRWMNLVAIAKDGPSYSAIATASMFHLIARPAFPDPTASRRSPEGMALVRSTLADPESDAEFTAADQAWLVEHPKEALPVLMAIIREYPSATPWAQHLMQQLEASEPPLFVAPREYVAHWKSLSEALGAAAFAQLTARVLANSAARKVILGPSSADPSLCLTLLTTVQRDAPYFSDVEGWAIGLMEETPQETWDLELGAGSGGPSLDLAVELADRVEAPAGPSDLEASIYAHCDALLSGQAVWQPGRDTFYSLTRLLSLPTRNAVATRIAATLGDRTEAIPPALFVTYGRFLEEEAAFRTSAKLPLIVERLISHDDWDTVRWIADVAERHSDTLLPDGREKEVAYLADRVEEKLTESSEAPRAELVRLAHLLGIDTEKSEKS